MWPAEILSWKNNTRCSDELCRSLWTSRFCVLVNPFLSRGCEWGSPTSDKGQKILPTTDKTGKNYRLSTGKLLTDYRRGPTLSIFFSERRVYWIFSTFLGSNQRYHVTSLFTSQYHKTRILKSVCRAYAKNFYNPPSPKHYIWQMRRLTLKENFSSSMESSTSKPTVPRWAVRQQFPLPTFSCHILKHKV